MVLHYKKRKEGFPEAAYKGGFVVQLENDMKTIKTLPVATVPGKLQSVGTPYEGHAFLEASSIRKIKNKYYLVYSSEQGHELCYALAENQWVLFHIREQSFQMEM